MPKINHTVVLARGINDGATNWAGLPNAAESALVRTSQTERIRYATSNLNFYQHTHAKFGGNNSMKVTFPINNADASYFINFALGNQIKSYDTGGSLMWQGFVNRVSVNVGGKSIEVGPFLDVVSRSQLVYSSVDNSVSPPVMGIRKKTNVAENIDVMSRYGRYFKYMSSAGATPTEAENLVRTYMDERAGPAISRNLTGPLTPNSVSLDCLGFVHLFKMVSVDTAGWGTSAEQNLSTWLSNLVGLVNLSLNSREIWFGLSAQTNSVTARLRERSERTAWDILQGIVARGDSNFNAWLFQNYENTVFAYYPQTSGDGNIDMLISNTPEGIKFSDLRRSARQYTPQFHGPDTPYWHVRAGLVAAMTEDTLGQFYFDNEINTPVFAIDSVSYNAPNEISFSGSEIDTLGQRMADLGLVGVGGR